MPSDRPDCHVMRWTRLCLGAENLRFARYLGFARLGTGSTMGPPERDFASPHPLTGRVWEAEGGAREADPGRGGAGTLPPFLRPLTRQPQRSSAPPSAGISALGCCRSPFHAPPATQPTREDVPRRCRDPLRDRIDAPPDMISRGPISAPRPDFAQTIDSSRFPAGVRLLFGAQDRHTLPNEWPQWPQWPQADFRSLEQVVSWGHS
jgi:hypothetical protein